MCLVYAATLLAAIVLQLKYFLNLLINCILFNKLYLYIIYIRKISLKAFSLELKLLNYYAQVGWSKTSKAVF